MTFPPVPTRTRSISLHGTFRNMYFKVIVYQMKDLSEPQVDKKE